MGKGDIKTTRGKIAKGTYGNSRPQRSGIRPPADNTSIKNIQKQPDAQKRPFKVN